MLRMGMTPLRKNELRVNTFIRRRAQGGNDSVSKKKELRVAYLYLLFPIVGSWLGA